MNALGLNDGTVDIVVLGDGVPVRMHGPARCAGVACPLHRPSHHPLRNAPLTWLPELQLLMRTCAHGHQHPDPDSMAFLVANFLAYSGWHDCCGHGCCGAGADDAGTAGTARAARTGDVAGTVDVTVAARRDDLARCRESAPHS